MLDAFAEWYYYHYIEVFTWLFGTTPDTALGTAIRVSRCSRIRSHGISRRIDAVSGDGQLRKSM